MGFVKRAFVRSTVVACVALLISALITACGVSSLSTTIPLRTVPAALNGCLAKHGIEHPEDTSVPSKQELAIPMLLGTYGLRVPRGVARVKFEAALKQCGMGEARVGQVPITSPILRRQIEGLRACLARNGFGLPSPDFSGSAPVLDTRDIEIRSARWVATVKGCEVTGRDYAGPALSEALLIRCLGKRGLEGEAKTNAIFQARILELPTCLRHS
jgi:hypothetical protein